MPAIKPRPASGASRPDQLHVRASVRCVSTAVAVLMRACLLCLWASQTPMAVGAAGIACVNVVS